MIIVFFHVLYLLGKFIYRNYREDNDCGDDVEENIGSSIEENQVDQLVDIYPNFYDDEESSNIRFNPPAYLQRYQAVAKVLSDVEYDGEIRKVVDFGCSELGFFQHMKNTRGIEEILCVDVDKKTLEDNLKKIEPLTSDYLACRGIPLIVHVLEGSVTDNDQYLKNCDAVICIELIEHLYPETCLNLPFNIFGFIQPKIAVFTTPNADFNVLFKRMTGFRHWDHKFEWTREQFQDWANNIVTRYPNYLVRFMGICPGPPGSEAIGYCSQMAIFYRNVKKIPSLHGQSLFKLIKSVEYPYRIDNRSIEEKTLQEAVYYIRNYTFNNDDDSMPLQLLAKWIDTVSIPILKKILIKDGWKIINHEEKGLSVLCPPLSDYSESNDINGDDEKWDEQLAQPAYQLQDWPEIRDQDEENWENDFDDSSISHQSNDIHAQTNDDGVFSIYDFCEPLMMDGHDGIPGTSKLINHENDNVRHDPMTHHSICSMYLQSSTCENDQTCPQNITNPDFQLSKISNDDKHIINSPNSTSTPMKIKKNEIFQTKLNKMVSLNGKTPAESSDNCSSCQKEKFEVMRKLKDNLLLGNSGNDKFSLVYHQSSSISDEKTPDIEEKIKNSELNGCNEILDVIETFIKESDDKAFSEARASPPNSWSPEIMDSGYPNTSSAHDITPECDLSSIGQDRISESESPSIAEPPRQLENFGVENGDLVNNNRDGEGNNVIPIEERDLEDFGPFIDVLENDLENENDIYHLENGFPVWLLRIFYAEGVAMDPGALGIRDEGLGDEVDENKNVDGV